MLPKGFTLPLVLIYHTACFSEVNQLKASYSILLEGTQPGAARSHALQIHTRKPGTQPLHGWRGSTEIPFFFTLFRVWIKKRAAIRSGKLPGQVVWSEGSGRWRKVSPKSPTTSCPSCVPCLLWLRWNRELQPIRMSWFISIFWKVKMLRGRSFSVPNCIWKFHPWA